MSITINGTSGISGVDGSAGTPALQGSDTNTGISFGADTVNINTGGTTRATVDSSGRVLVGTSSARSNLYNAGYTPPTQFETSGAVTDRGISITYNGGATTGGPIVALIASTGTTAGSNSLVTNGQEVGAISFMGTDGTRPLAAANITGNIDGTPGNLDMPGRLVFSTTADGASSPTERMRIRENGDILLNTTSFNGTDNSISFSVSGYQALRRTSGSAQTMMLFYNGSTNVGEIRTSTTATQYITSSDYRLKENVAPVADGIARLQQLKPSRFNFIADPGSTVDGFIAHEVQNVVPEAVSGIKDEVDADGNPIYQGIDQSKLVPLLTAALQEAVAKIETLETRLTALEGGTNP